MARSRNQQQADNQDDVQPQQEQEPQEQPAENVDGSEQIAPENVGQDQEYAEQLQQSANTDLGEFENDPATESVEKDGYYADLNNQN